MDLGDPTVRNWNEVFQAFDPDKVIWLAVLLGLEFILGVIIAFRRNEFDWDQIFEIAKKNVVIMIAWAAAFIYSENAGTIVYGLALAYVGGSVAANITSLLGVSINGLPGQILTRGPGDSNNTEESDTDS